MERKHRNSTLKVLIMGWVVCLAQIFLVFNISIAQTFNRRFVISEVSEGRGINETTNGLNLFVAGIQNDSWLTCSIGLDYQGNILDSLCIGIAEENEYGFSTNNEGFSYFNDISIFNGKVIVDDSIWGGRFIAVNQFNELVRDFVWISPMYNPDLDQASLMTIRDAALIEDNNVFISYSAVPNQEASLTDAGVICFDENDEMVWETQWVTEDYEWPFAITYFNDFLYVAIDRNPDLLAASSEISMYKLNPSNGDILEEWHEPWSFDITDAREIIAIEDGMVLAGSAIINENEFTDAMVMKIDENANELWSRVIDNPNQEFRGYFTEVVQTTDGNYVAAGEWEYSLPEFDEVNGSSNDDGWLVKFNAQTGDIIWDRKYHYIEDTNDEHEIYDLTACSDGGVAFTGEALDLTINGDPDYEYPLQQGWVVKVDEHGCVVPGCQNSVEEKEQQKEHFLAGPNPVKSGEELHIFLHDHSTGGEFSLLNAQGKTVATFQAVNGGTTYSLSTKNLSSGTYVLTLLRDNQLLQREKIIIN